MAKKPQVICYYCNKKFYREDEEFEQIGRRYAHKKCVELNDKIHNLMAEKCGDTYSRTKIHNQILKFTKDDYALEDIWGAINWWFNIRNEDASKANGGIGIFPHIYPDYINMQNQKNEYKQILGDKNINDYIDTPNKTVNINRKFIQKPKRVKLFDLK